MSSTVKSLMFWAVLVVVAVLIYNVSTHLQQPDQTMSFSQFMTFVDQKKPQKPALLDLSKSQE